MQILRLHLGASKAWLGLARREKATPDTMRSGAGDPQLFLDPMPSQLRPINHVRVGLRHEQYQVQLRRGGSHALRRPVDRLRTSGCA